MGDSLDLKKMCNGLGDLASQKSCEKAAEKVESCDSLKYGEKELCEDNYEVCDSIKAWPAILKTDKDRSYTVKNGVLCHRLSYIIAKSDQKIVTTAAVETGNGYSVPQSGEELKVLVFKGVDGVSEKWFDEKAFRLEYLVKNLDYLKGLIKSEEDLFKAASAIVAFIKVVEDELGFGEGASDGMENLFGYADAYRPDIGPISNCIDSLDGLPGILEKYLGIMEQFEFTGFNPMMLYDFPYQHLNNLKPAFDRYGFDALVGIAEHGGEAALNFLSHKDHFETVDKYGIEFFLDIARFAGKDASSIYLLFTEKPTYYYYSAAANCNIIHHHPIYYINKLIGEYGKDAFISLLKLSHETSYGRTPFFLRSVLPEIFDDIKSEGGLLLTYEVVMSKIDVVVNGGQLSEYDVQRLFEYFKFSLSKQSVIRMLERTQELSAQLDCSSFLLIDIFEAASIKQVEDIPEDGFSLLKEVIGNSKSERIHLKLAEMYFKKGDYLSVLNALNNVESVLGDSFRDKRIADLQYRSALAMFFGDEKDVNPESIGTKDPDVRNAAVAALESVCKKYEDSPAKDRSELLLDVIDYMDEGTVEVSVEKNDGITVKRIKGENTVSIIFVDGAVLPEVVPGKVLFSKKSKELIVPKYHGGYKVIFKKPKKTIVLNGDALLRAMHEMPPEFFKKVKTVIFTGKKYEDSAGDYQGNTIRVHEGWDSFGTVVHELAHHWDLSIETGKGGVDGGKGDISKLFYNISWKGVKKSEYATYDEWKNKEIKRDDFDENDFARDYGMRNPYEDIATVVEDYVKDGVGLRKKVREQLGKGNFELAVKYLYARYVMPFKGDEYGLGNESKNLGFDEVYTGLKKYGKGSVDQNTLNIVNKIARQSGYAVPDSMQ